MRLARRFNRGTKPACSIISLGVLLTLTACSLPDVNVERKQKSVDTSSAGFSSKNDEHEAVVNNHIGDSTYLATVHVHFSDSSAPPINFDVRRDKRDLVSFNVSETQQSSTYLHMGYSNSEGGIAGLRFAFRF